MLDIPRTERQGVDRRNKQEAGGAEVWQNQDAGKGVQEGLVLLRRMARSQWSHLVGGGGERYGGWLDDGDVCCRQALECGWCRSTCLTSPKSLRSPYHGSGRERPQGCGRRPGQQPTAQPGVQWLLDVLSRSGGSHADRQGAGFQTRTDGWVCNATSRYQGP